LHAEGVRPSEWRDRDIDAGHALMAYQRPSEDRIRVSNRSRPARHLPRTGRLDFDRDQVRPAPWQGLVDVACRCSVVGTCGQIAFYTQPLGGVRDLRLGCDRISWNGVRVSHSVVHGQPRAASARGGSWKANCCDSYTPRPRYGSQRRVKLQLFGSHRKIQRSDS
jgi:hypothetical protein